ncbi:hypothetical protein F511_06593 [Dorcoceras hygrometricum]|uniref:Uncharacterized protein n=1 Tax=Dorcoceras hygrometricum TaxID=472368 RepID=A0A2Z7B576_9LAMI|nr:hypothetical protein F511_06593 [Dorcoceras hygrometricum]
MASSFFVNAMQIDFPSVLAMEHTRMGDVTEFFANVKVIAGTIKSFVANRKMVITKDVFAEAFGLSTEGLVGFLDILTQIVVEIRRKFSGNDVPFRAPNKKKEMKMEYRLLHDIVAKALYAKAGSFDVVPMKNLILWWPSVLPSRIGVGPSGETSKVSGATASEQQSTADSLQSLTKKPDKEASEMKKPEKAAAENKKKNKNEKVVSVVVQKTVKFRSQAA